MANQKIFIASTGKDVGKTTLSLGLMAYLKQKLGSCGFIKPIGQDQIVDHGISLDKDAVLIKNFFKLKETKSLSPVSVPKGFTKDYLDQKFSKDDLIFKILEAEKDLSHYKSLVIEGTGHLGVGSIIDLNNAQVAKLLNAPIVLVTKGGLGSSFDELMLNLSLCEKYQLDVKGVVLNKVALDKHEMICHYFEKALQKINIPFLGALPYDMLLAQPTFQDVAQVLNSKLVFGHDLLMKHVTAMTIIASNNQIPEIRPYELAIVSSSREGLIHALIHQAMESKIPIGFILTGQAPPSQWILNELEKTPHFVIVTEQKSQDVLIELSLFHAKIQSKDEAKIKEAIAIVQKHVDLDKIF